MAWAIVYSPANWQWLIFPTIFRTRDDARFAIDHWPQLLKYNNKRIVKLDCKLPSNYRRNEPPSIGDGALHIPQLSYYPD